MIVTRMVGVGLLLAHGIAPAQEHAASNPMVDALAACLRVQDATPRLACFDAAANRLVTAERERDVVVVNRDEVRHARRSLFGLSLKADDVFAGRDKPADRIKQLDTTLTAARDLGHDHWALTLTEGGRWQTTEAWTLIGALRPGATVSVRPGTLGSYMLKVPGERAVRVQRVN